MDHYHKVPDRICHSITWIFQNEIGKPIFEFIVGKLESKHPGKHFLLKDVVDEMERKIDKNLATVNPDLFTKDKKYVLLSIEKKPNRA